MQLLSVIRFFTQTFPKVRTYLKTLDILIDKK
jgi:hypothetical protein